MAVMSCQKTLAIFGVDEMIPEETYEEFVAYITDSFDKPDVEKIINVLRANYPELETLTFQFDDVVMTSMYKSEIGLQLSDDTDGFFQFDCYLWLGKLRYFCDIQNNVPPKAERVKEWVE